MLIYQYHTICAAFVHICHWHIELSSIAYCAFFSPDFFFSPVSLVAAKSYSSMCQYYPLCPVLDVVLLSENLAINITSNTSFKLFIDGGTHTA